MPLFSREEIESLLEQYRQLSHTERKWVSGADAGTVGAKSVAAPRQSVVYRSRRDEPELKDEPISPPPPSWPDWLRYDKYSS